MPWRLSTEFAERTRKIDELPRLGETCIAFASFESFARKYSKLHSGGLFAYSRYWVAEATSIRWRDVVFAKGKIAVTGGDVGTESHEQRGIPMTKALRGVLLRLHSEHKPKAEEFVRLIDSDKAEEKATCATLNPSSGDVPKSDWTPR